MGFIKLGRLNIRKRNSCASALVSLSDVQPPSFYKSHILNGPINRLYLPVSPLLLFLPRVLVPRLFRAIQSFLGLRGYLAFLGHPVKRTFGMIILETLYISPFLLRHLIKFLSDLARKSDFNCDCSLLGLCFCFEHNSLAIYDEYVVYMCIYHLFGSIQYFFSLLSNKLKLFSSRWPTCRHFYHKLPFLTHFAAISPLFSPQPGLACRLFLLLK